MERDPLLQPGAFFPARRPPRRQPFDAHDEDDGNDDIYIMMQFCLSVTKNHHFPLGVL